jgi:hypothetical protein
MASKFGSEVIFIWGNALKLIVIFEWGLIEMRDQ